MVKPSSVEVNLSSLIGDKEEKEEQKKVSTKELKYRRNQVPHSSSKIKGEADRQKHGTDCRILHARNEGLL
jgi:hypothetical protein